MELELIYHVDVHLMGITVSVFEGPNSSTRRLSDNLHSADPTQVSSTLKIPGETDNLDIRWAQIVGRK